MVLVATALVSSADYLEVSRAVSLKDGPGPDGQKTLRVDQGAILRLLESNETNGYYHAAPFDGGTAGWVYRTFVRRWPGDPDNAPASPSTVGPIPTPISGAGGADASAFAIPGCPPEGNPSPKGPSYQALLLVNEAKNRMRAPLAADIHPLELSAIMASGDDRARWSNSMAVEVEGYVVGDTTGPAETCNCKNPDKSYHDTHIELTQGPDDNELPMIVEVTPEWRGYMGQAGRDWSTDALRPRIEGHRVRVRGWMLLDSEHLNAADNTNPEGSNLWRKTAWEIHPVTGIDVQEGTTWVNLGAAVP